MDAMPFSEETIDGYNMVVQQASSGTKAGNVTLMFLGRRDRAMGFTEKQPHGAHASSDTDVHGASAVGLSAKSIEEFADEGRGLEERTPTLRI